MLPPIDPLSLALFIGLLALVPLLICVTTAFLKIVIVMNLLRNALGVQQVPPNLALYALALVLTAYIMAPVGAAMYEHMRAVPSDSLISGIDGFLETIRKGSEPLREFLFTHSSQGQRNFFMKAATRLWPETMAAGLNERDFIIIMPSFVVTELTRAFEIGFLLFMPFLIIDLIVSNILLALGMMMVSPVTISLPLKLLLFVSVDGWSRLLHGLVLSYATRGGG